MSRNLGLVMALMVVLIGILGVTFNVQKIEATGTITIKADGSIEGTTDIMTVDNVTYTFTDNINGSIVIERDNIVVDGAGYTLQGTGSEIGINLLFRSNVTIKNMEIKNFWAGIQLSFTSDTKISGNKITAFDYYGIYLTTEASHNTISGNNITEPRIEDYRNAGIYLAENSGNNIISENNIIGGHIGPRQSVCSGIYNKGSSNNIISGNTIKDVFDGIMLDHPGSNNRIYHNNFIHNSEDFVCDTCPPSTTLDAGYPLGGNYWDKYNGSDLFSGQYQNETGSDGIGDTTYWGEGDNYPLMGMFSDFQATSEYHVQTICNSSGPISNIEWGRWSPPISNFQYNGTAICFNVTGQTDTTGFCRICITRALINETYTVFVNGTEVQCNLLPCSNITHSYLYFTYNHSTQEIIIIPEFPAFLILSLFMIITLLAVIVYRRKHST